MKTQTRARILEIIRGGGGARPIELVRELGISPQAVHRQLRGLVTLGRIEPRGRGPRTRYVISGAAQFDGARRWYASSAEPAESPGAFVCGTRDVFSARLERLVALAKTGFAEGDVSLAVAAAGEVGNNCFDHNLGNWRDVPGCWFEAQASGKRLWVCIADRGQGVFRTLSRAAPAIADDQEALVMAFEKILSGRAPENRGNGLKFVKNIMTSDPGRGLACRSGSGLVAYGGLGPDCREELARIASGPRGTITLMLWSMP